MRNTYDDALGKLEEALAERLGHDRAASLIDQVRFRGADPGLLTLRASLLDLTGAADRLIAAMEGTTP